MKSQQSPSNVRRDLGQTLRACVRTQARLRRFACGSFALLLVAGLASAGDVGKILGRDDLAFAQALSRHGYSDLAAELLDAIERSKGGGGGGGAEDNLQANVLRLSLQEDEANREPDPAKRGELLTKVVEAKEAFANAHVGSPAADDVLNGLPDLYRGIGELTAAALLKEEDPAAKTKLRETGSAMFVRAVDALQKRIADFAEKRAKRDPDKDLTPEDQALDYQYMIASYNLARTYYFHSLLFEADSFMKASRLRSALGILNDFQLDFADQLLCFESYIYQGLCHKELGELDKAIESFDDAIHLRERVEKTAAGGYLLKDEEADVVSSAVLQKMLVLIQKGDPGSAANEAREFFATTPNALETMKGLAVLATQADAYRTLGDQKGLEAAAKALIAADPRGPAGERGRELLGSSSSAMSAVDTMRLAEVAAGKGDFQRAIALCQDVFLSARGTADEANLGSKAGLFLGAVFAGRGMLHEAVVAWDTAADRYQKGKDAPECLWRAVNCYISLQAAEQRPYYKIRARDRMKELASRYPELNYGAKAAMIEGQQLEAEQEFAKAAAIYEGIAPGTVNYEEALYRAGNAWSKLAAKQLADGKTAEGKPVAAKAETILKNAITALQTSSTNTLDIATQNRARNYMFSARVSLANLYLLKGINRPAEVPPLFADVEKDFADDDAKISTTMNLRFRAYQAQGKIDDAINLYDAQIRKDPTAKWIGTAAAALASALDTRAGELDKDGKRTEADAMWRKAATYYMLAIKGQLDGTEPIRIENLEQVADRLFSFALHFIGVPKGGSDSFVDWTGARGETELLEQAGRAYEAVLPLTHNYRTLISLARTFGFLGRWKEAATRYAELFDAEQFYSRSTKQINNETVRAKPELMQAFLEWGVCEREAGLKETDGTRLTRAGEIFETLVKGTAPGSRSWWLGKYYQLLTLSNQGDYEAADIGFNSIERTYPDYDKGEHGLKDKFIKLREDVSSRVFKKK